jgi:3-oxoacyl-[acyl-carrier-protein] synthase-3
MIKSVITGTGAYIPEDIQLNQDFSGHSFFGKDGLALTSSAQSIIDKFSKITGINERRYVANHLNASDIAIEASREAILDSGIDPETLDQIIVSHNFGDVANGSTQSQNVPSLASKVKHGLGIRNPQCVAYDVLVGCPGWLHSLIMSHAWFKAGMARKILLVGTETLSRVIDKSDRDSMIFSDGAGACLAESKDLEDGDSGIMSSASQTHSREELDFIDMGKSFRYNDNHADLYLKMKGRKVYEYAITYVPAAMKLCLDEAGIHIDQVNKIFIHQANEKMDDEILKRLYKLYGNSEPPQGVMPMSIHWLGNSSVATIPTLYHMVRQGKMSEHKLKQGDIVLFGSVGAGMNINAVCYRV